MIKEDKIKIKVTSRKVKFYNDLGYNVKYGDIIEIPVIELQKGSHNIITGICDVCGKEKKMMYKTYIISTDDTYCCRKCSKIKKNKTMKKIYGVEHALQSEKFKEKAKNTWIKNLGVDHPSKSKKIKNKFNKTMFERYGVQNALENKNILNDMKNKIFDKYGMYFVETDEFKKLSKITCLEKYGLEYFLQTSEAREKSIKTCLKIYGTEYPFQNLDFFNEIWKKSYKMKKYNNSDVYYQGSYEKDFLQLCEKINILDLLKRGFTINYSMNNKNLVYFPDFYIEKYNMIIEIKSLYWYNKHKEKNILKEKACKDLNFNYILILDKNYKKFLESF